MKKKIIPSLAMCATFLATLAVQSHFDAMAAQGSATASAAKAAAAKAAADAREKLAADTKAAIDAFVKKHLAALNPQLPNLKASDLAQISETDLRSLYIQSYEKQGMSLSAAHAKAEAMTDLKLELPKPEPTTTKTK